MIFYIPLSSADFLLFQLKSVAGCSALLKAKNTTWGAAESGSIVLISPD